MNLSGLESLTFNVQSPGAAAKDLTITLRTAPGVDLESLWAELRAELVAVKAVAGLTLQEHLLDLNTSRSTRSINATLRFKGSTPAEKG